MASLLADREPKPSEIYVNGPFIAQTKWNTRWLSIPKWNFFERPTMQQLVISNIKVEYARKWKVLIKQRKAEIKKPVWVTHRIFVQIKIPNNVHGSA